MYTHRNFLTKKDLMEAVKRNQEGRGPGITYYQPGPFNDKCPRDGTIYLEGPHYPKPHKWYAEAEVKDGVIIKVK